MVLAVGGNTANLWVRMDWNTHNAGTGGTSFPFMRWQSMNFGQGVYMEDTMNVVTLTAGTGYIYFE
jgi:hypothetical protein